MYARTGYLGFLRRTEAVGADGDFHDAVFVVGSLDETLMLRGMRYHPIDIENSVMRSHKKIAGIAKNKSGLYKVKRVKLKLS